MQRLTHPISSAIRDTNTRNRPPAEHKTKGRNIFLVALMVLFFSLRVLACLLPACYDFFFFSTTVLPLAGPNIATICSRHVYVPLNICWGPRYVFMTTQCLCWLRVHVIGVYPLLMLPAWLGFSILTVVHVVYFSVSVGFLLFTLNACIRVVLIHSVHLIIVLTIVKWSNSLRCFSCVWNFRLNGRWWRIRKLTYWLLQLDHCEVIQHCIFHGATPNEYSTFTNCGQNLKPITCPSHSVVKLTSPAS